MALPSQADRSTETRNQNTRAGAKSGGKLVPGIFVGVLVVGAGWMTLNMFGKSPKTANGETSVTEPTTTATVGDASGGETGGPLSTALSDTQNSTPSNPTNPANTSLPEAPKPAPVDVTRNPNAPLASQPATPGTPAAIQPGTPALNTPTGTMPPSEPSSAVRLLIDEGDRNVATGKLVEARVAYSKALLHADAVKGDQATLREKLTKINDELVFSNKVTPGDPMVEQYTVASGDALEKIARKRDLLTRWEVIMRVNGISNPGALRVGQKLKLVRGPFHAVVSKKDYRLDLFWGSPDDSDNWLFIKSYTVGLGEGNSTPEGTFTIKNRMKNPSWKNPKTGEYFTADDPKNPIGEYWLGWTGQGAASVHTGFGLHGTIDPTSIGQQKSMGCVRMADADIEAIWQFLAEQVSVVRVEP
ncbi:MAG: L,D-transpeptidase family protein [Phycisphaerales bacterium]